MSVCDCCNTIRHRLALTVVARICLLLLICLIFGALHLFATPFPRRFFCTDQSLRYPIPAGSTVPYTVCAPFGVALATIVIVWFEVLRPPASNNNSVQHLRRQWRRHRWSNCLLWLYYFCLSCASTELLTVTAKLALGRHRPYFIGACRPDSDIADERLCNSSFAYPVSVCQPTMPLMEFNDAQMSFPSGHTSYSLFVAVFVAGYLQMKLRGCPAVRFSLQVGLILIGLCVGYSRVSDYKHHWGDVLGGAALGAAVAGAGLHTAAAAVAASTAGNGRNGGGALPVVNSATSIGDDAVVIDETCGREGAVAPDDEDDLVVSGPPRRKRLRDQAAIDAEESAAPDDADRDSGNVEDETKAAVARDANSVARRMENRNGNGVV